MSFGTNSALIKTQVKRIASLSWSDLLSLVKSLEEAGQFEDIEDLLYWRMAGDVELFAAAYFPHYCKHAFNEFHRDLFSSMSFAERAIRRARAAPRGYAKSTITALIKPIHDVCYGLEKYIVVVSNTQQQADQKLKDIRTEVLTNATLVADFGINFPRKSVGETEYIVHCGLHRTKFSAFGSGVEIRGIRFGEARPSKIVVDDSEHSEEVHNEALRKKLEDWYREVISKIGDENTNIEFIGTMLHRESLLAGLLKNPAYEGKLYKAVISWSENQKLWDEWKAVYTNLDNPNRAAEADQFYRENEPGLLKGVRVLWPEKEPYLALMKEMIETGRKAFMKEKQNEPSNGEECLFDEADIHWFKECPDGYRIERSGAVIKHEDIKQWAFGVMDPSTGQTKARVGKLGDFSCIVSGYKDPKGRLLVVDVWIKRASPTKYIKEIFAQHDRFDYQKFGVETNLYRNLLLPNIIAERKRIEQERKKVIQLPFYDIENVENKEKRVYTLEPKVAHGWILFNRTIPQEAINQLLAFPHGDHDDFPDALEMLWGLVNNRYKAASLSVNAHEGR
jgi:predicted phage terminase large subunit-like protein